MEKNKFLETCQEIILEFLQKNFPSCRDFHQNIFKSFTMIQQKIIIFKKKLWQLQVFTWKDKTVEVFSIKNKKKNWNTFFPSGSSLLSLAYLSFVLCCAMSPYNLWNDCPTSFSALLNFLETFVNSFPKSLPLGRKSFTKLVVATKWSWWTWYLTFFWVFVVN